MWVVYQYTFSNGCQYTGSTAEHRIEKRRKEHKDNAKISNRVLQAWLVGEEKHKFEVLSRHRKKEVALKEESRQIKRCPKPLNAYYATGLVPVEHTVYGTELAKLGLKPKAVGNYGYQSSRKRDKEPRAQEKKANSAICSICRRRLSAGHFTFDKWRHNGLASRCSECHLYCQLHSLLAHQARSIIEKYGGYIPSLEGTGVKPQNWKRARKTKRATIDKLGRYRKEGMSVRSHRLEKGLCALCGLHPREGRKQTCVKCSLERRMAVSKMKNRRLEEGKCGRCGRKRERLEVKKCNECSKADSEYAQKRKEDFYSLGLCRCGRDRPVENRKSCAECLAYTSKQNKKYRENKKSAR